MEALPRLAGIAAGKKSPKHTNNPQEQQLKPGVFTFSSALAKENPRLGEIIQSLPQLLDSREQGKPARFAVKPLHGGNSNRSYMLEAQPSGFKVFVREFGEGVSRIVDREAEESAVEAVQHLKLTPRILAKFRWGRAEELLQGYHVAQSDTLAPLQLLLPPPPLTLEVMKAMAVFHTKIAVGHAPGGPHFDRSVNEFLQMAVEYGLPTQLLDVLRNGIQFFHNLHRRLGPVKAGTTDVDRKDSRFCTPPVVFCHNDFNPGNVLFKASPQHDNKIKIQILDYEYAGANYRSFDIGNFFAEQQFEYVPQSVHAYGFRTRFRSMFSGKDLLPLAFAIDVKGTDCLSHDQLRDISAQDRFVAFLLHHYATAAGKAVPLHQLVFEYYHGMMASDFMWALWSIVLSCELIRVHGLSASGASGLDYAAYGEARLNDFLTLRDWLRNVRESDFTGSPVLSLLDAPLHGKFKVIAKEFVELFRDRAHL